jgi:hypothetical protein
MWIALKRIVITFIMKKIVNFLGKRGLRIAHSEWAELLAHHLEVMDSVKTMVDKSGEIATLRVKHPRVYKRLTRLIGIMQEETHATLLSLNPPITVQEEGEAEEA